MSVFVIALILGGLFGAVMALNGNAKRRDKRDANRYLAEKLRTERAARKPRRRCGHIAAAVVAVFVGIWLPGPASARTGPPVQTLTVIVGSDVHIAPRDLATVEADIVNQSRGLRLYWGTPLARFGVGGWPVIISDRYLSLSGDDMAAGFHL